MTNLTLQDANGILSFEEYLKSLVCTDKGASIFVVVLLLVVGVIRLLWPFIARLRRGRAFIDVSPGTQHASARGDTQD